MQKEIFLKPQGFQEAFLAGNLKEIKVPNGLFRRLDTYLSERLSPLSRSQIKRLIEEERVLVNNTPSKPSKPLKGGEVIRVLIPPPKEIGVEPQDIPLDIIYEDKDLLVINKPAGMVVHPGAGVSSGTLVNALLYHCKDLSGVGGALRPGIVHRLDKDTSGIIVVAKDDITHRSLSQQFKERGIEKVYLALSWGNVRKEKGIIDIPIGRHPYLRKKISTISRKKREAVTYYEVIERFNGFTLLKIKPETGRTHQIRVHLSTIHHPVVGDKVYGRRKTNGLPIGIKRAIDNLKGHALHASAIRFFHPGECRYMEFEAPLPHDFAQLLRMIRDKEEGCKDLL